MTFVSAVAYHLCLNLSAAASHPPANNKRASTVLRSTLCGTSWIMFYENKFYRIEFYTMLSLLDLQGAQNKVPLLWAGTN